MKMSPEGVAFLSEMEGGMQLLPYVDSAGLWTIGVGHLIMDHEGHLMHGITEEEGLKLLATDLYDTERCVQNALYMGKLGIQQHEFDALCVFAFNVGCQAFRRSTLLRLLNQGHRDQVGLQLECWMYRTDPTTGEKVQDEGLMKRRRETADLFYWADYVRDWHALGLKVDKSPDLAVIEAARTDFEIPPAPPPSGVVEAPEESAGSEASAASSEDENGARPGASHDGSLN